MDSGRTSEAVAEDRVAGGASSGSVDDGRGGKMMVAVGVAGFVDTCRRRSERRCGLSEGSGGRSQIQLLGQIILVLLGLLEQIRGG